MKLLTDKIKKLFRLKKGETLVEAIISILLLTMLLVTVTAMIQTSRQITARLMRVADEMQVDFVNNAVSAQGFTENGEIIFRSSIIDSSHIGRENDVYHDIRIFDSDRDIISFIPLITPDP